MNKTNAERNHELAMEWAIAIDREYNGWTNYPTWNVFLWLSNDESDWNAFLAFGQTNPTAAQVKQYIARYVRAGFGQSASCATDIAEWAKHYRKSIPAALKAIDYESIREHLADAVNDAI